MLEAAARPIGGLCSRVLRFEGGADPQVRSRLPGRPPRDGGVPRGPGGPPHLGVSLEELLLQHALGQDVSAARLAPGAHGVMMIPIPASRRFTPAVDGVEQARETADIEAVEITAKQGQDLEPLPEGPSYLGFLFARAQSQERVEQALRAGARLPAVSHVPGPARRKIKD